MLPIPDYMDVTACGPGCPRCGCRKFKITTACAPLRVLAALFAPLACGTSRKYRICKKCGHREKIILFQ